MPQGGPSQAGWKRLAAAIVTEAAARGVEVPASVNITAETVHRKVGYIAKKEKPTGNGAHEAQLHQMEVVAEYKKKLQEKSLARAPDSSTLAPRESAAARATPLPPPTFDGTKESVAAIKREAVVQPNGPLGTVHYGRSEANQAQQLSKVRSSRCGGCRQSEGTNQT